MSLFVDFVGLNTLVSSSFETGSFDNILTANRNAIIGTIPESELLVATNIHRNGPYNFATFKQIRIHENPLTRYQRRNNLLSFSKRPEQKEITDSNNNVLFIQEKFGDLVIFTEPAVVSSYHPLVYNLGTLQGDKVKSFNRFGLSFDYGNHITYFTNEELNKLLLLDDLDDEVYEQIKELYLNGALETNASEVDYFEFLRYKQIFILARSINTLLLLDKEQIIQIYFGEIIGPIGPHREFQVLDIPHINQCGTWMLKLIGQRDLQLNTEYRLILLVKESCRINIVTLQMTPPDPQK